MNGAAVIAEILKREDTEFLSCYPRNPLIEASAALDIRPILCRQERCRRRHRRPKGPPKSNRQIAETKDAQESPPVRGYSHRTGKSLFARDCVVGLGGLELPTKRLLPRHE